MINFFFLLEIKADIYLNPALHSALWKTGDKVVMVTMPTAGWHPLVHAAFRCANSNHPLAVLQSLDPKCCGWKNPLSQSPLLPSIPRSFQYGDLFLSQQRRDQSFSSHFCCVHWLEKLAVVVGQTTGRILQAVPSAHPGDAQRINWGNRPGRLVPAVINGYPKTQANHNGCYAVKSISGANVVFVCFCFFFFVFLVLSVCCL